MRAAIFPSLLLIAALAACEAPPAEVAEANVAKPEPAVTVPADLFTPTDEQELDAALAKLSDGQPVFVGLPSPPLASCGTAADARTCRFEQLKFIRDWRKAYSGDYSAQRNVAYGLSREWQGVAQDHMQGCAWRAVIINAADPEVGAGDVSNLDLECGALTPAGRAAADAQAARIAQTIAAR